MSDRPKRIVIVGRDAALWLAAAAVSDALRPAGVSLTAIELPTRLTPASVYATQPAIEALHAKLGIDEAALLRTTRGSFTLGWNVVRSHAKLPPFFLAHGGYGAPIDGGDFFPYWVKARRFGLDAALEDFSPTAMAARHGRLLLPDEQTEQFGRTDYAYHLPAIAYVAMLKTHARRFGVEMHQALQVTVDREGQSGRVTALAPDGGDAIPGDLFVDASGGEAVLIGKALGVAAEDWRDHFPFRHRLLARAPRFASIPAYAEVRVSRSDWTALHASQADTYVSHAFAGDDAASAMAVAAPVSGLPLDDAVVEPIAPALRRRAWAHNCVAIGAAAGALDPVFDLDLHAVHLGVAHLLSLFPASIDAAAERAEYNRLTTSSFERMRDFQAAFYRLNGAGVTAPASLSPKIDAYLARGTIAPMEDETFTVDQWRALFVGMGVMPDTWPPAIDATPPDRMKDGFRQILAFVRTKVLEQPTHDRYLADLDLGEAA